MPSFLSACANRTTSSLDLKHKSRVQNVSAYVERPQNYITVEVAESKAAAYVGGLWILSVYDVIQNSITEGNAAKRTQLLQAFYIDTKVQNLVKDKLNQNVNQQNWFKSTPLEFSNMDDSTIKSILEKSTQDAVIFHKIEFSLAEKLDMLKVTLNVQMYPTQKSSLKLIDNNDPYSKPLLAFTIHSTAQTSDITDDADENIGSWEWNNGENFKSAIKGIVDDIMKKYQYILNNPEKTVEK